MSYRKTAASTIQAIFSKPKATPYPKLMAASVTGILKNTTATTQAVNAPAMAHKWGFTLRPASSPNRTTSGRVATKVESHHRPKGS
jgi:hypothetical protein